MTFFQVGAIVGADLKEQVDPNAEMQLRWDRKETETTTVMSSTGARGKIS